MIAAIICLVIGVIVFKIGCSTKRHALEELCLILSSLLVAFSFSLFMAKIVVLVNQSNWSIWGKLKGILLFIINY